MYFVLRMRDILRAFMPVTHKHNDKSVSVILCRLVGAAAVAAVDAAVIN